MELPPSARSDEDVMVRDTISVKLYKAIRDGDWSAAKVYLERNPELLTAPIFVWEMIVIHMAVASSSGALFLRELLDYMSEKGVSFGVKDIYDQNALHYAARSGDTEMASLLLEKDPTLVYDVNNFGHTPLQVAAQYSQASMVSYLMLRTDIYTGQFGIDILVHLVYEGFYERAIELLDKNPTLVRERDSSNKESALYALAKKPEDFPSGSRLTFWQRGICQVFDWINDGRNISRRGGDVENQSTSICDRCLSLGIFRHVRERKLKHEKVVELLEILIEKTSDNCSMTNIAVFLQYSSHVAAREGIHEFVAETIKQYPIVVASHDDKGRNLFSYAVMHRQHEVFNLFFQIGSWKSMMMTYANYGNNMLHHAANWSTAARNRIGKIPGAALQMQRELQWYKKVEELVQPSYKVAINNAGKTPGMLFAESHKELVKEGEGWMKGTANSYTIVAALVVTITFAAAFTIPGGTNGNSGLPMFLRDLPFMIFAIANALAFFASATSLLMFLGILTSRCAQEDFLRALPLRLAIGLVSLFFSIASTLVAFTAGIHVMISDRVSWIAVPAGILTCTSLTLFTFLQGPLLWEVAYSTFGPSIFGQGRAMLMSRPRLVFLTWGGQMRGLPVVKALGWTFLFPRNIIQELRWTGNKVLGRWIQGFAI